MTQHEDVRKQWNNLADYWISRVRNGEDSWREYMNAPAFKKMIGDVQGLRLLDLACGEGYFSRFYAKAGAEVTGIDISESMIAAAREEESKTPLGIQYHIARAQAALYMEKAVENTPDDEINWQKLEFYYAATNQYEKAERCRDYLEKIKN